MEKDRISDSEDINGACFLFHCFITIKAYLEVLLTYPLPLQERFLDKSFSATVWLLWIHVLHNEGKQGFHDFMIKCVDV